MKKIKLFAVVSLDGFTAPNDGSPDWFGPYGSPEGKADYLNIIDSAGTVIMDDDTYHGILAMDVLWPYQGKEVYVITDGPVGERKGINFVTEDAARKIAMLKEGEGKDILLPEAENRQHCCWIMPWWTK